MQVRTFVKLIGNKTVFYYPVLKKYVLTSFGVNRHEKWEKVSKTLEGICGK